MRLQAVFLCVMNLLFCVAFAAFVLYAEQRLGLGPIGFGLLLSVWAVGGLIGTAGAARLLERFGPGALLRAGLIVEVATQATLAATTDTRGSLPPILVVFGIHTVVWGTIIVVATAAARARPVARPGGRRVRIARTSVARRSARSWAACWPRPPR